VSTLRCNLTGLESLHREAGADEVEHHPERPVQIPRPTGGRRHGEQLAGRGKERLSIHAIILPSAPRQAHRRPRRRGASGLAIADDAGSTADDVTG
jgi:hypothetical protein